jgi:hypothetical protein
MERRPVRRVVEQGTAVLMPDLDRPGGWLVSVDDTPQSYVDLEDPTYLEFEYVLRLGHLTDLLNPPGRIRALHLGGGGLTLARYIQATRPGSAQHVVEFDAALLDLVREELPWEPAAHIRLTVGEARAALAKEPAQAADLIVADVFAANQIPIQVTSVEFAQLVERALAPTGCYAANIADSGRLAFARTQVATLRAVFPQVCLVAEPSVLRGRRFGNILLVASRVELPVDELTRRLAGDPFPARVVAGDALAELAGDVPAVTDATAVGSPKPPPDAFALS